MPKSKRNKQIELSKTKKRGLEWKKKLFEEIRSAVDSYSNLYIFSVSDMRNSKMKNVRNDWKDSRFFFGKNKIMAMALGRFAEEEYRPNLYKIGQRIKGLRALLFSNRSSEDVLSWFRSYTEGDFARSGNTATEDVKLSEGPLPQFPHDLEPYLRQLGLPTSLVKGVIHLVKDHEVCKEGDILTPETAKILKLLGYEMAEFHITINCMWSQDGTFMPFAEDDEPKENKKKNKRKSNSFVASKSSTPAKIDVRKVEDDDMSDSSEPPELVEIISPKAMAGKNEVAATPVKSGEIAVSPAKFPKNNEIAVSPTKPFEANASTPIVVKLEDSPNCKEGAILNADQAIEYFKNTSFEAVTDRRKGRSKKRHVELVSDSIVMDVDMANSSHDSPVFRELRNRSVKVSRKRNK